MARKPKITAVPVEQSQMEEGLMIAMDAPDEKTDAEHEKTDAEQMTEIIKEVKEEPTEEQKDAVPEVPVVAKAKAKRASRAKPKEEPIIEEPKEEPNEDPNLTLKVADQKEEEPKEEPKSEEKVACPDCGRRMSAKTLKYSHGPNCSRKKQQTNTEVLTLSGTYQPDFATNDMVEHHLRPRIPNTRADRANRREAMMSKLMQAAF